MQPLGPLASTPAYDYANYLAKHAQVCAVECGATRV